MSAELISRITAYLSGGGLFNPELAIHDAVRDLLIDCRTALSEPAAIGDAKVVPLEPTEAMLMAGYYPNFEKAKRREMYQAMLAAAPAEAHEPDARAKELFERNSAGYTVKTPWDELHEDTRQIWRDFAAKRPVSAPPEGGDTNG